jgi:hypothetical protein
MRMLTVNETGCVAGGAIEVAEPCMEWVKGVPKIDYCGSGPLNVPDSPGGYSFSDACKTHDMLYSFLREAGQYGKSVADSVFLGKMLDWCKQNAPGDAMCKSYAYAYFAGVVVGGGIAFKFGAEDKKDDGEKDDKKKGT